MVLHLLADFIRIYVNDLQSPSHVVMGEKKATYIITNSGINDPEKA